MIAIDWGTTSFRAYRLDAQGNIVDTRSAALGILTVPPGQFAQVLEQQVSGWSERPIVMSGMVGSRQGWVEAPYVACPAGLEEVRAAMREVREGVWIVPGVSCRDGVPDVMRGEEVQVLGAGSDGLICLPGTHSKWVVMEGGKIRRFRTYMTGEVFAVLKQHSILGRMMEEGKPDPVAFADGVARSGQDGGLLHHLFGVRTRALMDELGAAATASYLSGILIGHELRSVEAKTAYILGAPELASLYVQAARQLGIAAEALDPRSGVRALFRLGAMLRPSHGGAP
jgi:2-dehydro-3-deoxygalactonokinase